MKFLFAVVTMLALSGCGDTDKMESACQAIVRDSLVDPASMVINDRYTAIADMKLSEAYEAISKQYHGNTPPHVTVQTDQLAHREKLPELLKFAVDYTANGGSGKFRDLAVCSFVVGATDKPFLYTVRIRSEELKDEHLDKLFLVVKRPEQLDSLYFVK